MGLVKIAVCEIRDKKRNTRPTAGPRVGKIFDNLCFVLAHRRARVCVLVESFVSTACGFSLSCKCVWILFHSLQSADVICIPSNEHRVARKRITRITCQLIIWLIDLKNFNKFRFIVTRTPCRFVGSTGEWKQLNILSNMNLLMISYMRSDTLQPPSVSSISCHMNGMWYARTFLIAFLHLLLFFSHIFRSAVKIRGSLNFFYGFLLQYK